MPRAKARSMARSSSHGPTAADVAGRQAEEDDLVAAQFEVADQSAVVPRDMHFVVGPVEQRLSRRRPAAGARTKARPADAIVESR